MALQQKRIQVKEVTEPNEKYSLRIWLVRLGMSGIGFKEDRRILMKHLTGHSAFKTEADKGKWLIARKKAKLSAEQLASNSSEQLKEPKAEVMLTEN